VWIALGAFAELTRIARDAYDRIVGLILDTSTTSGSPPPRSPSPTSSAHAPDWSGALELTDDIDPGLLADISRRRTELAAEHTAITEQLRALRDAAHDQPNPQLINALPVGACDLDALPEPLARQLFEALRLEIHYDKRTHTARYPAQRHPQLTKPSSRPATKTPRPGPRQSTRAVPIC
jgi:hypothetical protein